MKKILLIFLVPLVFWCGCTEKTYNYYLEVEKGSLAGVVQPAESGARVSAWQGKEVRFTFIDSSGYFILSDLPVGTYTVKVEADGYTTYESNIYTVYKGGVTTVGTITLGPFPDLIRSVYPQDKATDVPPYISIWIYFSTNMNKESLIEAFSISPPTEGTFIWRDYYGNLRDLQFQPTHNLVPFESYIVTLDTSAQDTAGNHLAAPFSFSFTISGVGVESFYPRDGQTGVSTDIYIYIYFNTIMDRESVEEAFEIHPPTAGELSFSGEQSKNGSSRDRLLFKADPFLKTNTLYTISLDTTAHDTSGIAISEPLSFFFITEKLKIDWTYPRQDWVDVSTSGPIRIRFNAAMNESTAEEAFSIVPDVEGDFDWPLPGELNFDPDQVLASNTLYTIEIDESAKDLDGTKLQQDYSFSFTTAEIRIISSPAYGANYVHSDDNIQLYFNTDMDQLSLVNAFSMIDSDSVEIQGDFSWSGLTKMIFDPDSSLALGKAYTVTVSTDAMDIRGVHMPEEFVLWFKTRP